MFKTVEFNKLSWEKSVKSVVSVEFTVYRLIDYVGGLLNFSTETFTRQYTYLYINYQQEYLLRIFRKILAPSAQLFLKSTAGDD